MGREPNDINSESCFRLAPVPDIGLKTDDMAFPLRVYVLKCRNGTYYVGILSKSKVQGRINDQFEASQAKGSSHFCEVNAPVSVLCVLPAKDASVEAAMFFATQGALGITNFKKL